MDYSIRDFSVLVQEALCFGKTEDFLERWNADPNIVLEYSETPVTFKRGAFNNDSSDCYVHIHQLSGELHREIPFITSIDESLVVDAVLMGEIGHHGMCDWEDGDLLQRSSTLSQRVLGHTHPRHYGAICSAIYWTEKELLHIGEAGRMLLESGLWRDFGGDFAEIYLRSLEPGFSDFSFIGSPREGYLGVFRVAPEGRVIYHPWKLEE